MIILMQHLHTLLTGHGFIALNATTPIFKNNPQRVPRGMQVWVEFQNHDGANPHTPTVTVTLLEKV